MTEIEELIRQAKETKERLKQVKTPGNREPSNRTWQEILDNKPYPSIRYYSL